MTLCYFLSFYSVYITLILSDFSYSEYLDLITAKLRCNKKNAPIKIIGTKNIKENIEKVCYKYISIGAQPYLVVV